MTFNHGVPGSIPGWATKCAGVAELADALDLGSSAFGCKSSTLFICTKWCVSDSMVECHLAKVDVAGSSPVFRSIMCGYRISVILQPSKLERWVRFPLPAPKKSNLNKLLFFVLFWNIVVYYCYILLVIYNYKVNNIIKIKYAPITQVDRVQDFESWCPPFKSG